VDVSNRRVPCILHFDSLVSYHDTYAIGQVFRLLLADVYRRITYQSSTSSVEDRDRALQAILRLPVVKPNSPRQIGGYNCGLHHIINTEECIVRDPCICQADLDAIPPCSRFFSANQYAPSLAEVFMTLIFLVLNCLTQLKFWPGDTRAPIFYSKGNKQRAGGWSRHIDFSL
jgi:hypothetical protein